MTLACSFVQSRFRRVLKRAAEAIGASAEERYWVLRKGVVEFWHSDPVKAWKRRASCKGNNPFERTEVLHNKYLFVGRRRTGIQL